MDRAGQGRTGQGSTIHTHTQAMKTHYNVYTYSTSILKKGIIKKSVA
jgi:hypothetical protein